MINLSPFLNLLLFWKLWYLLWNLKLSTLNLQLLSNLDWFQLFWKLLIFQPRKVFTRWHLQRVSLLKHFFNLVSNQWVIRGHRLQSLSIAVILSLVLHFILQQLLSEFLSLSRWPRKVAKRWGKLVIWQLSLVTLRFQRISRREEFGRGLTVFAFLLTKVARVLGRFGNQIKLVMQWWDFCWNCIDIFVVSRNIHSFNTRFTRLIHVLRSLLNSR